MGAQDGARGGAERGISAQQRAAGERKPPGKFATYRGAFARVEAYETPALAPELRRRVGDRAENLQAYEVGVKREMAAAVQTSKLTDPALSNGR